MRLSTRRAPQGRALGGTLGRALIIAAVLGGLAAGPALSKDKEQRDRPQERGHRVIHPAPRPQPYGYYPPYGYAQPYSYYQAPPPVIYVPPPSPGISLFFGFPRR